jgi:hypothetical protein
LKKQPALSLPFVLKRERKAVEKATLPLKGRGVASHREQGRKTITHLNIRKETKLVTYKL